MKRSTLTLSILTALLVSACGGSGSDDQGAKDPDPKPTPTNPTPSNPTPSKPNPGSSVVTPEPEAVNPSPEHGSAPIESGGNQSTGGVYIPPKNDDDGAKDKDDKDDKDGAKDKDDDGAKDKDNKDDKDDAADNSAVSAAEAALKAAKDDFTKKDAQAKAQKEAKKKLWEQQRDNFRALATKIAVADGSIPAVVGTKARAETVELQLEALKKSKPEEYAKLKPEFDAAKLVQDQWLAAKEKEKEDLKAAAEANAKVAEEEKKLALAKAEQGLKDAKTKAQTELHEKNKELADANFKLKEAEAKVAAVEAEKASLTKDAGVIKEKLEDITEALKVAAGDTEKVKTLTDKKSALEKEQKDITAKLKQNKEDKKLADAQATHARNLANKLSGEAGGLKEIAGNRGVSSKSGFNADSLVEIQKAEFDASKKWKLTFKDDTEVEIDVSSTTEKLGGSLDIFKVGKNIFAFGDGDNTAATAEKSVYGYNDGKFYSVGKVTAENVVAKMTDPHVVYSGKAILTTIEDKKDLIAEFGATVDFKEKSFGGSFKSFKSYDPVNFTTAAPQDYAKLKDPVPFNATIEGNEFKTVTAAEGKASVYGFFYGNDAAEAGGLVELKDVFHGSFGGKKVQTP